MKVKPDEIEEQIQSISSWHANLIRFDRRKCIFCTHDATLFSFFLPGLTKPDFQRIEDIFGQALFKSLVGESFPQSYIELFLDDIRNIKLSKTNSRSVLGSMTDLTFQIKLTISQYGGLANTDIFQLNYDLNRVPMIAIKELHSIQELRVFLYRLSRSSGC